MKLNISIGHFEEIIKRGYSLDVIFLLNLIHSEIDISGMCKDSVKINVLFQSLIRKGLVTDDGNKLTTIGQELLVFMDSKDVTKFVKKKTANSGFDEWWKLFPGTDTFEYKGKHFTGCRSLRQNKEACRLKFDKILLEGEYSATQLIDALKYDVTLKKEQSVKTGNNKLTYMQNSLTFLNQRGFENFIELINSGIKAESEKIVEGTNI